MTNSDFHFMRVLCIACLLPALCMAALGGACAVAEAATPMVKVACFKAADWGPAPEAQRPCTTVVRPDNDQVRIIQGSAAVEQAECIIDTANINDAQCHRIKANRAAPTPIHGTIALFHPQAVCNILHQCAAVGRPQEDGSNSVYVYNYGTLIERCILSNPVEEHGNYTVPCEAS